MKKNESLEKVWKWKNNYGSISENMTIKERIRYTKEQARDIFKKANLRYTTDKKVVA